MRRASAASPSPGTGCAASSAARQEVRADGMRDGDLVVRAVAEAIGRAVDERGIGGGVALGRRIEQRVQRARVAKGNRNADAIARIGRLSQARVPGGREHGARGDPRHVRTGMTRRDAGEDAHRVRARIALMEGPSPRGGRGNAPEFLLDGRGKGCGSDEATARALERGIRFEGVPEWLERPEVIVPDGDEPDERGKHRHLARSVTAGVGGLWPSSPGGPSRRPRPGAPGLTAPASACTTKLVGAIGLEPTTPTMSRWCSNQLSYAPAGTAKREL